MVPFRVLCAVRTWIWSCWQLCCTLLLVQLFALRASSRCEYDIGALSLVKCGSAWKSIHPSLWQTCKVLCPWALFHKTTAIQGSGRLVKAGKAWEYLSRNVTWSERRWGVPDYKFVCNKPEDEFLTGEGRYSRSHERLGSCLVLN